MEGSNVTETADPDGTTQTKPPETDEYVLTSLRYYDELRMNEVGRITREDRSNIDILQDPETSEEIALCHLSVLSPFTNGDQPRNSAYEDLATLSLAAHHLNTGDGSIVPMLDGLNDRCKIRFTLEFVNTRYDEGLALDHVVDQISRKPGAPERRPCAFVGEVRSSISVPTSIVTGLFGYPQVSGASTSAELDDKGQHSLFARTIPSDADNSVPIIMYMREVLQVTRLAVLHSNDPYGNAYALGLRNAARDYTEDMIVHAIPVNDGEDAIKIAVRALKQTGYRYVYCLVYSIHDDLMTEAYNQGVAGTGEHNWFYGDSFNGLEDRTFEKDSILDRAYRGVGELEILSGAPGIPAYDKYVEAMAALRTPEDLKYLRSLLPVGVDPSFIDDEDFLSTSPNIYTPFFFDAAVALGISACNAISGDTLDGQTHFDVLAGESFSAVTGTVAFDAITGTREVTSAKYRISNWVPEDVVNSTGATVVKFRSQYTDLFEEGQWSELREYIFNDGTANVQPDFVDATDVDDDNWTKSLLMPIVLGLVACIGIYIFFERKRKQNDTLWYIRKKELKFASPPEVIGRGSFGVILKADYRGTPVAIKRAIPPSRPEKKKRIVSESKTTSPLGSVVSQDDVGKVRRNAGTASVTDSRTLNRLMSLAGSVKVGENGLQKLGRASVMNTSAGGASRRKSRQNFISEMRILSKLRHSSIATVMGAVMERGSEPMLVMEYMDHGSLYDVLQNDTMYIERDLLLHILQDVSQGMRFLHASVPLVVHGDLKAANILVDSRFRAKVADFGLSQDQDITGRTGTPFWMAPELLRAESTNTRESDVFSFGIILYEVFSRKVPYDGEDPATVLHLVADEVVQKRPPVPQNMPPQIQSIMKDSLQDDASTRPSFEEIDMRLQRLDASDLQLMDSDPKASARGQNTTISLHDIFPRHIAVALREGRTVEPEHHDMVTISFSDIVGFTQLSAELEPRKVADLLNRLYTKFDALSMKHDVFKVETIGDSYMAVTNLVKDQSDDHAKRMAEFAMDLIKEANETLIDEDAPEKGFVNTRVGFHSGSVVSDVVGTRNLRYCLFGDAVNTASRMESNSKPNRIHCSSVTAELLASQGATIPLKSRGLIEVKGKGEFHTYWVNEGKNFGVLQEPAPETTMLAWAEKLPSPLQRPRRKLKK